MGHGHALSLETFANERHSDNYSPLSILCIGSRAMQEELQYIAIFGNPKIWRSEPLSEAVE
jgi:hypothetical protein